MSLLIEFEFLRGLYEAGRGPDRAPSEWPPHPARVFNALVAAAESADELDALRWLERQPAPVVHASRRFARCGGRASYVPTNRIEAANTYGAFPARRALGPVAWNAHSLDEPIVAFEWAGDCPPATRIALSEVVTRVPYLGRSTSPVVGRVADQARGDLARFRPVEEGLGPCLEVPFGGYLDRLVAAYDDERHAWEVPRRSVIYADTDPVVAPSAAASPYSEMLVLGLDRRFAPGHVVAVTSRLREAIESHADGGPLVLRGLPPASRRSAEEATLRAPRHQVLICGLPFVGHEHATGQVVGLAVVLPSDVDPVDRRAVLRGLAATVRNPDGLKLGKLGLARLDPAPQPLRTLDPNRWCGPDVEWVSALPISANRYHRKLTADTLEGEILRSCRDLDLPEPTWIEVGRGPMIHGAATIAPRQRVRHPGDAATASFHAWIRFPEPVRGPIVLGSMRRYGLGLMAPVRSTAAGDR